MEETIAYDASDGRKPELCAAGAAIRDLTELGVGALVRGVPAPTRRRGRGREVASVGARPDAFSRRGLLFWPLLVGCSRTVWTVPRKAVQKGLTFVDDCPLVVCPRACWRTREAPREAPYRCLQSPTSWSCRNACNLQHAPVH